jgi:hypothetical protein
MKWNEKLRKIEYFLNSIFLGLAIVSKTKNQIILMLAMLCYFWSHSIAICSHCNSPERHSLSFFLTWSTNKNAIMPEQTLEDLKSMILNHDLKSNFA